MLKGVKLRLYPKPDQVIQLWQLFGNDRFVWNQLLAMMNQRYENNPELKRLNRYQLDYLLPALKIEYPFLKLSDSSSLQVVTRNLNQAWVNFFQDKSHQVGKPRFHSRHYPRQSYTGKSTVQVIAKRYLKIPKLGYVKTSKTGCLKDGQIKQYTLSHDATGRYYLAIQLECPEPQPLPKTHRVVGLDLGLAHLVTTSDGQQFPTLKADWLTRQATLWQRKYQRRKNQATKWARQWNHDQRHFTDRDVFDYQNWQRAQQIKARYQGRVAQQRLNYLHQLSTELVKKYDVIVIEDLKVKNLQKNHRLARSIANAGWYQFRQMLTYKCDWYGKQLIVVNPRYTSQQCSNCGFQSGQKPLAIREWTCSQCQTHHDRDINAAVNIRQAGLKLNATGSGRTLVTKSGSVS
ncbi:RNA-guided endonuclease InsQ/TnpB family protein [Lentilactobacillus raoultii]|uniref:RNA-guided endonuclease InsQ/TnpB family protein n=1 Tax=Lentilactobacillus raoultii TaxID=1987503 RepID=A0ABW3PJ51_9LACO|nr:RNA-guided endonuclease TnpB family protein [Lentilactobacillus raoultii]